MCSNVPGTGRPAIYCFHYFSEKEEICELPGTRFSSAPEDDDCVKEGDDEDEDDGGDDDDEEEEEEEG